MAYSLKTWSSAEVLTAAQMNTHVRDNIEVPGDWTPTWTQSATITKTITFAKYHQVGDWVEGFASLAATSAGTASNAVVVTTPVTALTASNIPVGTGFFFDDSETFNATIVVFLQTTGTFRFLRTLGSVGLSRMGVDDSYTVASGDTLQFNFGYYAA